MKTERQKNVIADLAVHYGISQRAVWEALKIAKAVFGY
jgi:hypothetical protein